MSEPLPPKFIRFEFYTVLVPEGSERFSTYLQSALEIRNYAARALTKEGQQPVRWEFLEKLQSGLWVGDITRIRDDVVPNKAARNRPRERLVLREDEGTTEDTIFAYSPKFNVLVYHNNRFGVSATDIVDYFLKLGHNTGASDALPVLTNKAITDLEGFQYFDKIHFKVARPTNGPMPRTGLRSVDSCINAAAEANAKYFDLTLSVGRAKMKMAKDYAKELVGGLLNLVSRGGKRRPVRKLVITGMAADGQHDEFDLLKNRLQSRQQVQVSKDRDLPYEHRKAAAISAYKVCRSEIAAQFSKADDDDT